MAGLGLVHSLYRAHRAVVPATAWHFVAALLVNSKNTTLVTLLNRFLKIFVRSQIDYEWFICALVPV